MGKSRKTKRDNLTEEEGSSAKKNRSEAKSKAPGTVRIELEDEDEVLLFLGQAELVVEEGSIDIDGAHLQEGSTPLHLSADYHIGGALVIRAEASRTQTMVPLAGHTSATLLFTGVQNVNTHYQLEEGGPSQIGRARNSSFQVMRRNESHAPSPRVTPDAWHEAINGIEEAARILEPTSCLRVAVTGSRGMGKSTFARLLVNALLNIAPCVAFLDTDLGQPEFTPSGVVSVSMVTTPILGPPHLHQRPPEMSHFLGDVSPQGEPERYLQAVRSLHAWYCHHSKGTGQQRWAPLVVNTHGWIQGMGLQSLEDVLGVTAPTHVVMLQSVSARKNLPHCAFWLDPAAHWQPPPQLLYIPGINSQEADPGGRGQNASKVKVLAPIDARGLSWLAFSRRCCGLSSPPTEWDATTFAAAAQMLMSHAPFAVPFSRLKIQVMHTCLGETQLLAALNCSIVGLASSRCQPASTSDTEGKEQFRLLPCLGFGIVRSVDAGKGMLYILTDVEAAGLEKIDVIQVGKLQLPPPLLQTIDKASPYLSFWSIGSGGTGSGVIKSRNTLTREGQK